MISGIPPHLMLSGVALLFAGMFGLRARAVLKGEGADTPSDDDEGRERSPPRIPPATWPIAGALASLALALFVWTSAFPRFLESGTLASLLLGMVLGWTGSELAVGLASGQMTAAMRGKVGPFSRLTQPKRYWASAIWNALFSVLLIAAILGTTADLARNACTDPVDTALLADVAAACDRQLAKPDLDPADRSQSLTGRAYARIDEDDVRALADLDQALALDNDNGWAWHLRGYHRLRRRQFAAADADLSQAIRIRPDRAVAYFDRARARASLGALDTAMADIDRAIQLDPDDADFRQLRGEFHRALGHRASASEDFSKAAKLRVAESDR